MNSAVVVRAALVLTLMGLVVSSELAAQEQDWGARLFEASRGTLEAALSQFDAASRSQAYSPELRALARSHAAAIRGRLAEGDFRVGDRVYVSIERVAALTDTFVVAPGRVIVLPDIGDVPVAGILRSEVGDYLTQYLSRFLNEPVVQARPLIRVSILGEVGQPGFYRFPVETPLTDALMLLGGPTADADLSKVRIDRGAERILVGPELQAAIQSGETLDEIKLEPGDEILVPRQPRFDVRQVFTYTAAVAGTIFAIDRILGNRR